MLEKLLYLLSVLVVGFVMMTINADDERIVLFERGEL